MSGKLRRSVVLGCLIAWGLILLMQTPSALAQRERGGDEPARARERLSRGEREPVEEARRGRIARIADDLRAAGIKGSDLEQVDRGRARVREWMAEEIRRKGQQIGRSEEEVAEDVARVLDPESELPYGELLERYESPRLDDLAEIDQALGVQPYSLVAPSASPIMVFPSFAGGLAAGGGDQQPTAATVTPGTPALSEEMLEDEEVREAYRRWLIQWLDRQTAILGEQQSVISITNRISWFIFIVVHLILLLGLWAATKEFRHASRTRREKPEQSEFRLSMEGIALKTALHGLLLLAIAFAFYFVYLRFVYPVTVVPM
jgi:hypothetical protein